MLCLLGGRCAYLRLEAVAQAKHEFVVVGAVANVVVVDARGNRHIVVAEADKAVARVDGKVIVDMAAVQFAFEAVLVGGMVLAGFAIAIVDSLDRLVN